MEVVKAGPTPVHHPKSLLIHRCISSGKFEKHMNKERQMQTIKNYWDRVPYGMNIACGKGEKLLPVFRQLLDEFGTTNKIGSIKEKNRQVLTLGDTEIKLVRARDVVDWLNKGGCFFALTSFDAICEWAAQAGYKKYATFTKDYEIAALGTNRCQVEVACARYARYSDDLISAFKENGLAGLDEIARRNNLLIGSDIPNLAKYFFTSYLVDDTFEGSIELLPQYQYQLIVSVVESGDSLARLKWVRLSEMSNDAVLLNSQTCIVTKRRNYVDQNL